MCNEHCIQAQYNHIIHKKKECLSNYQRNVNSVAKVLIIVMS